MTERLYTQDEVATSMATATEPAMEDRPGDHDAAEPAERDNGGGRPQDAEVTGMDWLTEDYDYKAPKRGQLRRGEVLQVNEDQVVLDVGLKRDGLAPAWDVKGLDQETLERLAPGEAIMVRVVRPADREGNLIVSMSQALSEKDWDKAEDLLESGDIWTGRVSGYNKGGLLVGFNRIEGFVPMSHLGQRIYRGVTDTERDEKLRGYVGREIPLKIIEADRARRRLILSERKALAEQRAKEGRRLMDELQEGQIRRGTVRSLVHFGAFVDLGGVDGLIHTSELSWKRVGRPSDVLKEGDEIDVYVLSVDRESERIGLSLKRLQLNPWETVQETYYEGQLVQGQVTNVRDFGAFVALDSGIEGLLHVSEIDDPTPGDARDRVLAGDELVLRVLGIEPYRERMSLSLKRVDEAEREMWLANHGQPAEAEPSPADLAPGGEPEGLASPAEPETDNLGSAETEGAEDAPSDPPVPPSDDAYWRRALLDQDAQVI